MDERGFLRKKKIAIVYDWIDTWGGVERVLLTLHEMFPHADFYTSYYDEKTAPWAKKLKIKTSFIQNLPNFIKKNRLLSLLLYPYAFESFNLSTYEIVISVSSSFAKSVITKPDTLHICYLLTPTRFLWVYPEIYTDSLLKKIFFTPLAAYLRKWDFIAAACPDYYLAISKTVQKRVRKYYQRNAQLLYPPFDTEYWTKIRANIKIPSKNYFLVVSRLEKYKKIDLVIDVFNQINKDLIIVGKGTQLNRLKKRAKENIAFMHTVSDKELGALYQNAQALIMAQEEDFGYVALEAGIFGCPVIAYRAGGATETVIEGETGIFFDEQTEESLTKALAKFHTTSYTLKNTGQVLGQKNGERFNKTLFIGQYTSFIQSKL